MARTRRFLAGFSVEGLGLLTIDYLRFRISHGLEEQIFVDPIMESVFLLI
jgi:hypothetical protein